MNANIKFKIRFQQLQNMCHGGELKYQRPKVNLLKIMIVWVIANLLVVFLFFWRVQKGVCDYQL